MYKYITYNRLVLIDPLQDGSLLLNPKLLFFFLVMAVMCGYWQEFHTNFKSTLYLQNEGQDKFQEALWFQNNFFSLKSFTDGPSLTKHKSI